MVLSSNKKIKVYPCKPHFYCIKVGFKWVKTILACFRNDTLLVLLLAVLCIALWLLAARLFIVLVILLNVLLLCLVNPVYHGDHLVEVEGASYFALRFFDLYLVYILSVMVCLIFLLVLL